MSTVDQCEKAVLERLEANAKLKRQNFGSQSYGPPVSSVSSSAAAASQTATMLLQPSETPPADSDSTIKKGKCMIVKKKGKSKKIRRDLNFVYY